MTSPAFAIVLHSQVVHVRITPTNICTEESGINVDCFCIGINSRVKRPKPIMYKTTL